jgi:quercetin dioxygenase-like cupin family protein
MNMTGFTHSSIRNGSRIALATLGLAAATALLAPGSAHAGSCPADKVTKSGQQPGATAHSGVTDTVIGSIDLAREKLALKDHKFRLRRLVVQPGGVVAWHSHADRPAIIYIVSGTIMEYASSCAVPITHHAGEVSVENHATSHWWKNTGKKPAVLLSADILHDAHDQKSM